MAQRENEKRDIFMVEKQHFSEDYFMEIIFRYTRVSARFRREQTNIVYHNLGKR